MTLQQLTRRLGFIGLRALAVAVASPNSTRLSHLGQRLGVWHYRLRPRLRNRLIADLKILGELTDQAALKDHPERILYTAYQTNNRAILEILALYGSQLPPEVIKPHIRLEGIEQLHDALSYKKGVVLMGMHMGNGVAMAHQINQDIAPVHVVYRESRKVQQDFFKEGLSRLNLSPISTHGADGGLRQMMRTLKSNHILYILLDQGVKRPKGSGRFLHKPFEAPAGPAELATRTGAAIVPSFLIGTDDKSWTFRLGPPIVAADSANISGLNTRLIELMEKHILEQPQWWSWHQRRWSKLSFDSSVMGAS